MLRNLMHIICYQNWIPWDMNLILIIMIMIINFRFGWINYDWLLDDS